MAKTLVLFWIPDGPMLKCQLSDLALVPQRGSKYVFEDQLFEVTDAIETLGRNADGSPKNSDQQLLSLLSAVSGDGGQQLFGTIAGMKNIGAEQDELEVTQGGIIVGGVTSLIAKADRVLLLHLTRVKTGLPNWSRLLKELLKQNTSTAAEDTAKK